MVIRKANLGDLKIVHDIETESFGDGSYPLFVLRQLFDISSDYFLVAEKDGVLRGYILGNYSTQTNEGWILSLGVHPKARGENLGKLLAKKMIMLLEDANVLDISLTVHPENTAAIKIYEALDFEVMGSYSNYYFDHTDRLVMKRKAITSQINT